MARRRVVSILALVGIVVILALPQRSSAQIDPEVRDRVIPAAVQIAVIARVAAAGAPDSLEIPLGSGTVVSADGLILTSAHVVDFTTLRLEIARLQAESVRDGLKIDVEVDTQQVRILTSNGSQPPQPTYVAEVVDRDTKLDLAVLRIVGDQSGASLSSDELNLPFIPLATAGEVQLGEPIDIFGYPGVGGSALTYTTGVVSGFAFEDGITGTAWINTDATMAGGSSGGTAVNRQGELIGVPTSGSELDCRPGDTNRDGELTADDVGCIPVGGSIGQLRPAELAEPLLQRAGFRFAPEAPDSAAAEATIAAYSAQQDRMATVIADQESTIAAQATVQASNEQNVSHLWQDATQVAAMATEGTRSAQATIAALAADEAEQAAMAATVSAMATEHAATSDRAIATAQVEAGARATELARREALGDYAQGTVAPLATAQADIATLEAERVEAQATMTALERESDVVLDPTAQTVIIRTDLDGMLGEDPDTLAATRSEIGRQFSRFPLGCRAGFMLISGKAPSVEEGVALSQQVDELLREGWPDIFDEATGEAVFALPGEEPSGETSIDIFFYSGCEPIE